MAKTEKRSSGAKRPRRASQRTTVSINLAKDSLLQLMTEQCKDGYSYVTVYQGSRVMLQAAGIPDAAFPTDGQDIAEFQVQTLNACCTGSKELLTGSMRCANSAFELEIDWGAVRPYVQCSHPAVSELARMLLKDVLAWTTTIPWSDTPDLALPMDMLAADPRSDYKPVAGAPRLQVTPEFFKELRDYSSKLYQMVHSNCEVLPVPVEVRRPGPPLLKIVATQN